MALGLWWPAFWNWESTGFGDWQQFHHWWEIGVVSIRRWGQLPLWDPHHCGGVSQWGQPQAQNYSPLYLLLAVPLGTTLGHKLWIVVHHVIGFTGLYLYARREEQFGRAAASLAAIIWTTSGFCAWHFAGGHSTFLAFQYYPFLLLAWRLADRDVRWTAAVALTMTELLLEGGHYPFPYAAVILGFDSVIRLWGSGVRLERALPIVRTIAVSGVLTLTTGAFRWVPIMIAMSRHPRPIEDTDTLTLSEVVEMWTARSHSWSWPGHQWVWAEYGTYVGWGVLAFAAAGGLIALWQRRWALWVGFAFYLAFSMGYRGPYWPSSLLHGLPFFSNLHLPSRWQVACTMYLALLAGLLVHQLERWLSTRHWGRDFDWTRPLLPWALVVALAVDLYAVGLSITNRWNGPPIGTSPIETPHLIASRHYHEEFANYPSRNLGTTECYDAVPWLKSRDLWLGEVPQVRIVGPDGRPRRGDVLHGYDRQNYTAWADVELSKPGRIIFNQNHEIQWKTSTGTIVNDAQRLAVDLPAGRHQVEIWFSPDDLPWSFLISLVGFALCALVIASPRWLRSRQHSAG